MTTKCDLTCNQILKVMARSVWEKDGNKGEPPAIPTVEALVEYDAYKLGSVIYPLVEKLNTAQEILGKTGPIYQTPELREACDRIIDTVAAEDNFKRTLFDTVAAFGFVDVLIADFAERIERLHAYWQAVRDRGEKIPHILEPIVRAWLVGQIPKVEPTRRQDTGILHHAIGETHPTPRLPMTVMETVPGEPEQLMLLKSLPQVELQLELPGFVFPESELVPALPLEAYDTVGGKPSQQGGGAPISQRLFCNVLVEYAQKQRGLYSTARLNTNYRDVKSWLYPKGTTNPKSVLIPRLYKGMYKLHNLRFLWERRAWNIISVDSLPTMEIRPDDPLTFTVRMPDGMNTNNGALIGIEPLRIYGAQAAPKFRAWVRLAYLWDAAKIRNGGRRIYATIPEVLRDSDDHLTDAKGQKILTGELYRTRNGWKFRQGNLPQTAWYHPLAIQTGRPERNPQGDKVPVLSNSDMVKLFYDHKERKGTDFTSCLELAEKHAEEMQEDGTIVLEPNQVNEKTDTKGWRILEPHPSVERKLFTR